MQLPDKFTQPPSDHVVEGAAKHAFEPAPEPMPADTVSLHVLRGKDGRPEGVEISGTIHDKP